MILDGELERYIGFDFEGGLHDLVEFPGHGIYITLKRFILIHSRVIEAGRSSWAFSGIYIYISGSIDFSNFNIQCINIWSFCEWIK